MNPEPHWERVAFLAYLDTLREFTGKLLHDHYDRSAVVKILWTAAQSALAEAERFNTVFPRAKPLGPDDFVWLIELKRELLAGWSREELEAPE